MPTKGQPSGSSKKHAIEVDADPDIIEVDDDDDSDIEMLVAPTQGIVYKHPSNGSSRAHSKASTPNPPFKSGAFKPQKAKKRVTTEKILIEISDDDEPSKTVSKPFHSLSIASHASEARIQSPQKRPREEGNFTSSHAKRPPGKKRRTEPPKGSPQPLSDHSLLPKVESSSVTLESSSDESDSFAYDAFEPVRLVFRDVDDRAIPSSLEADVPFDPDARHNTQPPGFNKSQSAAFKGISSRTSLFGPRSYSLPDGIDPRIGARQSLFSYDSPVRTNHGNVPRSLHLDKPFNEYELAKVFNRAAGAINKVVQRDGWIAACASSHGGGFDWAEAQADPYNRSETVLLWHLDSSRNGKGADSGDVRTFSPHCRTITRAGQRNIPPYTQHCTVVDIQFGPYGDSEIPQLVTAGEDGSVRVWKARFDDWDDEEESLQRAEPETFEAGLPQLWEDRCFTRLLDMQVGQISFKPTGKVSLFAVAARDVYIFALPDGDDDDFDFTTHLPIASKASTKTKGSTVVPHVASSYQWGRGPTDGYIYVSSESRDGYQGYHFEYPIETPDFDGGVPQPSSEFEDAKGECGDAMGIDEYGATLALVTASSADSHTLRLYDVSKKLGKYAKAFATVPLLPKRGRTTQTLEITSAFFVPSSTLVALTRSDNAVHLYDRRYLRSDRDPLVIFGHEDSSTRSEHSGHYGVTQVEWCLTGKERKGRLASCGNDGCVRLWNPALAANSPENNTVVATSPSQSDLTWFSMGHGKQDDHDLVLGAGTGEISVWSSTMPVVAW